MEEFNKQTVDGVGKVILGNNEGTLGAQCSLALDGGQLMSSGSRVEGDAPEHPRVELVPPTETREGCASRHPSTKPGPRCIKEERERKERIREEKRREADGGRRQARKKDVDGRRAISPAGSETALSIRSRSRASKARSNGSRSRATSSASTTEDVEDSILGKPKDPPAETKESPMEVSPGAFPRASTPSASGSRGRGRPPTTGEYIGYSKAQREASEAKQMALDLEAEKEVSRTGLAAGARMAIASREDGSKKRAGDGTASALLASQGDEAAMAAMNVDALRWDASTVSKALLTVASTSKHLKGTYVRELKVAADVSRNIVDELGRRAHWGRLPP